MSSNWDLAGLVESTVGRYPRLPAIEVDGTACTYGELWRRAGQAAGHLAEITAQPRIGLCAGRTLPAYVGYLAILRLGRTVVPMNPAFPAARTIAVARACGMDTIVVDEQAESGLVDALAAAGLKVTTTLGDTGHDAPPAAPPSTAYIMFTSGSTGRPKGVPIGHSCLTDFLPYVADRYELGPGSRMVQTYDLTFDPSVLSIFATWHGGGTVVVPRRTELSAPAELVRRHRISHWYSVPSVVSVGRRFGRLAPHSMPRLAWSVFCGEQLTVDQAEHWREAAPNSVIENTYGPTELTISCSDFRLPRDRGQWPVTSNGTVPIGPVYPHMEQVIVDAEGRVSDTGELCVRGSQLFAGYLDPADDRGRFGLLDGTFGDWPADRPLDAEAWYRTGDLVRDEPAGIVHLGRLDRQVKVNGYRIELGEIEHVLRGRPEIDEAVALAVDGTLVVFCTGLRLPDTEVKETVAARLPRYMVPEHVRHLTALPLNANGKVDHHRLTALYSAPAPVLETVPTERSHDAV